MTILLLIKISPRKVQRNLKGKTVNTMELWRKKTAVFFAKLVQKVSSTSFTLQAMSSQSMGKPQPDLIVKHAQRATRTSQTSQDMSKLNMGKVL